MSHEELREDEIEALLKFDGAKLEVIYLRAGKNYMAVVIIGDIKDTASWKVSAIEDTRRKAVQEVWKKYRKLTPATTIEKLQEDAQTRLHLLLMNFNQTVSTALTHILRRNKWLK